MPDVRPFRLLLAVVIGAALQLCCCSTRALAQSASGLARGTVTGHARGCCHPQHDQSTSQSGAPSAPTQPDPDGDHRCLCGMSKHAPDMTDRTSPIDTPQIAGVVVTALVPLLSERRVEASSRPQGIRDQSLLRQHCALML